MAFLYWPLAVVLTAAGWTTLSGYWKDIIPFMDQARLLFPLGPHFIGNLARSIYETAIAVLAFLALDTIGLGILRLLRLRTSVPAVRLASVPVAYGLLSLSLLGSAMLGLWFPAVVLGLPLALFAVMSPDSGISTAYWKERLARLAGDGGILVKLMVLGMLLFMVFPMFAPDLTVDSVKYHLACPQQYLARHKMYTDQVYFAWKYPMVMEFPHSLFEVLGAYSSIQLLALLLAATGILGFLSALPFTLRPVHSIGIIGASLLFHDSGWVALTAKNDLAVVALGMAIAGLAAARLGGNYRSGNGLTLLAGFLLGMFFTAKFVVLPYALTLALAVFLAGKRTPSSLAWLAAGAALTAIPWSLKSFVLTGDPLFPLFTHSLPGLVGNGTDTLSTSAELRILTGSGLEQPLIPLLKNSVLPMMVFLAAGLPALYMRGRLALLPVEIVLAGLALQIAAHRHADIGRYAYFAAVLFNTAGLSALLGKTLQDSRGPSPSRLFPVAALFLLFPAVFLGMLKALSFQDKGCNGMISPAEYLSGRLDKPGYRAKGLFAYGLILPLIPENPGMGRSIIETGDYHSLNSPRRIRNDGAGPHPIWSSVHESGSIEPESGVTT